MGISDPYYDPNRIVRAFIDPQGGTSECRCFVTADGKIWRETMFPQERTCQSVGSIKGNRIIPR